MTRDGDQYRWLCQKMDKDLIPEEALKVRGKTRVYYLDRTEGHSLMEPGRVGAIDLALWMDNNAIEEAISSLSRLGRDPVDWKRMGMIALVGIVAIYVVYLFMA